MWSAKFKTMPQTEFDRLLQPELLPDEILFLITHLKEQKQQADEKVSIPPPTAIRDFHQRKTEEIRHRLADLEYRHPDNAVLTELLQRCVKKYSFNIFYHINGSGSTDPQGILRIVHR